MHQDLVSFLQEQLAKDERAARAATPGPWTADGATVYATHPTDEVVDHAQDGSAELIARFDPARVLREVDAKRKLVEEYVALLETADPEDGTYKAVESALRGVLESMASAHEQYRSEWRP